MRFVLGLLAVFVCAPAANAWQQDAAGWTVLAPSGDTRTIYVDSALGSDANSGLSSTSPVKTLAKATSLLRNGMPDHLLLKAGSTWNEPLGLWTKGGRSATEPMVISSYGQGPRPLISISEGSVINAYAPTAQNLAIKGLAMRAGPRTNTNPVGVRWVDAGSNLLLEDNVIDGFRANIIINNAGTPARNIAIRRNAIVNAYALYEAEGVRPHSSGVFIFGTDETVLEQNLIDHNGWAPGVSGAEPTFFNHNVYLTNENTNVVVRNNIISRASSHGVSFRPGGVIEDNLIYRNPIGIQIGSGTNPNVGGVIVTAQRNIILEGTDIGDAPRAFGISATNIQSGVIADNIIAHPASLGTQSRGILLNGALLSDGQPMVGINNLAVTDNVVLDMDVSLLLENSTFNGLSVFRNIFNSDKINLPLVRAEPTLPLAELLTINFSKNKKHNNTYHHQIANYLANVMATGTRYEVQGWADLTGETHAAWADLRMGNIPADPAAVLFAQNYDDMINMLVNREAGQWNLAWEAIAINEQLAIYLTVTLPGDANLDGTVNVLDMSILADHWNQNGHWMDGDFTGDGYVNTLDLSILSTNWGAIDSASGQTPFTAFQSLPEPTTGLLMLAGVAGLMTLGRPRRHAA